jgi:hypothetical protein
LNHQGWWPKNLKVLKDLEECEVEALFGSIVNNNGYKYMECGDPKLIVHIENLWMTIHQKTWLPTSWSIPITMAKELIYERKSNVMNWALPSLQLG